MLYDYKVQFTITKTGQTIIDTYVQKANAEKMINTILDIYYDGITDFNILSKHKHN